MPWDSRCTRRKARREARTEKRINVDAHVLAMPRGAATQTRDTAAPRLRWLLHLAVELREDSVESFEVRFGLRLVVGVAGIVEISRKLGDLVHAALQARLR